MRLSDGLEMLELGSEAFGHKIVLNPVLVWDEEDAVLIDTGMPGQLDQILKGLSGTGISLGMLKAVVLTHQDIDHIGNLPDLLQEADGRAKSYAHKLEKPYIEGERPLLKTDPGKIDDETKQALPKDLLTIYENPPKAKIDRLLEDGMELPFCGGIQVIATPGHTDGHISLYLKKSKTLITGDALVCSEGILQPPIPKVTPDMKQAVQSLEKLLPFDINRVICYHGGAVEGDPKERIREIMNQANS
ncbi:MBL fold metallo-hydrolase [Bacillus swezeyi]|uniref:MBL fold metallo-hydrolase n=1 Tax=Bacillus swezeyi TaxID=1925020 RepID=A0A1R1QYY9_9BACI|nr:MBL fold metallo-hydrolase [Bacillus swezeyi]MEC1262459.1 MBL fold metallo-hydrolase [Bacillus swezeyi]MED2926832.1 MBL fold metallo-hydrolase [Bacillus swezeyi]MED2943390.1 MBL fold metallo-hydrolase [Bacillus swezeyi]MED2965606.1 MBL fold metallo-hydrolase [Bacillus swezeyi]MED2978297.1 MBL fold metallo-hydrolase [Bacillus swezeyi]